MKEKRPAALERRPDFVFPAAAPGNVFVIC
jgi:hypothetical protein